MERTNGRSLGKPHRVEEKKEQFWVGQVRSFFRLSYRQIYWWMSNGFFPSCRKNPKTGHHYFSEKAIIELALFLNIRKALTTQKVREILPKILERYPRYSFGGMYQGRVCLFLNISKKSKKVKWFAFFTHSESASSSYVCSEPPDENRRVIFFSPATALLRFRDHLANPAKKAP